MIPHAALYAAYFAFVGVFFTYIGLYLKSIGLSGQEIAILMALTHLVRVVMPVLIGWLADRTHRRMAVVRATFALAVSSFGLMFITHDFVWLCGVFLLMCGFWSGVMPLFEALVVAQVSKAGNTDMGRYGRIRLWGSIGFVVAVASAGWLLDHIAIAWLLWMVFALMLLTLACCWWVPEGVAPEHRPAAAGAWTILRQPMVLLFFCSCFLNTASQSAGWVFYAIYLVDHGYSKTAVGALTACAVIAEIALLFQLARVARRFPAVSLWRFGFAATTLRYAIVGLMPGVPVLQALAQTVHMFTFGTHHATALAVTHRLFPGRLSARGQAFYSSVSFGAGGTFGGLLAGWSWQTLGATGTFLVSALLAALALAIAMSATGSAAVRAMEE
jgi:PPP family 3-phenylpropionic acid transporter